jgi:hypothetical protein
MSEKNFLWACRPVNRAALVLETLFFTVLEQEISRIWCYRTGIVGLLGSDLFVSAVLYRWDCNPISTMKERTERDIGISDIGPKSAQSNIMSDIELNLLSIFDIQINEFSIRRPWSWP